MALIYHIAAAADWEQARRDGQYTMSTRDRTLAEEGFIHTSTAAQVALVANAFYRDAADLLLLVIDPGRVAAEIRYEHVPGQDLPYPHIYGPLNVDAVVMTRPFAPAPDGTFSFDPKLSSSCEVVPPITGTAAHDNSKPISQVSRVRNGAGVAAPGRGRAWRRRTRAAAGLACAGAAGTHVSRAPAAGPLA
jgi:uncharacterized protein (DUF952 family)